MDEENKEVVERARKLKENNNKESLEALMEVLSKATVYVPGALPPNTPIELIKAMSNAGVNAPLPKGVKPNLALIANKDGKKFLPGFTSHEEVVH